MTRRQTGIPEQWLIADVRLGEALWPAVSRLPRGGGILLIRHDLSRGERAPLLRKLRRVGRAKGITVVDESPGSAARVHDAKELRRALERGTPLILLSPLFATRTHPEWRPLPRMRAATFVRLAKRPVIALGGMDARRFRSVQRLGFAGWAGIDAFLRSLKSRGAAPFS